MQKQTCQNPFSAVGSIITEGVYGRRRQNLDHTQPEHLQGVLHNHIETTAKCLCQCASLRSWSKLQRWCPNYTQVCTLAEPGGCLTGATGYAPGLSAPRCPISVLAPKMLGGIPSDNAKVLVFPTCLRTTGEGWPKAMRHENACLLCGQNLGYHCQCPPKTLLKFQETGRTVTHTL